MRLANIPPKDPRRGVSLEDKLLLGKADTFRNFNMRINEIGGQLRTIIKSLRDSGATIAAFGAPTKSTTLLAQFNIDPEDIDYIVDDNPLKQGLYSPLKHIPVLHPDEIYKKKPDYLLILAWNFSESIMLNHKEYVTQGGKFILPMPIPKVVS